MLMEKTVTTLLQLSFDVKSSLLCLMPQTDIFPPKHNETALSSLQLMSKAFYIKTSSFPDITFIFWVGDESWGYSYALPAPNVERNEHVFFGQTLTGFFLANTIQPYLLITFTKCKYNYVVTCTLAWEAGITVYLPCD